MKFFLFGYFGRNNFGDEAILHSFLGWCRGRLPGARFRVLTANPECTARRYGVEPVAKTDLRGVWRAVCWSDVIVAPGGGIFQDSSSVRSVVYYLGILMLGRLIGRPVFMLSQGMGPLERGWVRKLVGWGLDRCVRRVWVRDERALEFMGEFEMERTRYGLGADMVFSLEDVRDEPRPGGAGGSLRVAVSLRPCEGLDHVSGVLQGCLLRMCKERPVELHLFAFDSEEDVSPTNRFAEETRRATPGLDVRIFGASRKKPLDINEVLEAIGGMDVVVGMRLHSLVFAALKGVPFVGLSYDPKVKAFSEECSQPVVADLASASAVELDSAITRLAGECASSAREALTAARERLRRLLRESLDSFEKELHLIEDGRFRVLGIPVSGLSMAGTLERIEDTVKNGGKMHIVTVNPEMVMRAGSDEEFGALLKAGCHNTPDGVGIRIVVRLKYRRVLEAVTGVDLAEALLSRSKELGWRIFLLGGRPETVERCVGVLASRPEPPLIVGYHHGYLDGVDAESLKTIIRDAKPDIVLVGMGSPLQEYWIRDSINDVGASVFMGVGGTFDVLAGDVRRAPTVFRKTGLEWAYRIISEPSRLRRVSTFPSFMVRAVLDAAWGRKV